MSMNSDQSTDGFLTAFTLGDGTIAVRTPSQKIAKTVERFLPEYVVSPDEHEPNEIYSVWEEHGGWRVRLDGTDVVDSKDCLSDVMNAIEQLAITRLLAVTPKVAQVHAAGTVLREGAVLVLGASGAGKTSIALNWSAAGHPVLGDDVVLLDEEGTASPFKRLFMAPADRLATTRATGCKELEWLSTESETWYDPRSGGGWAEPAPVRTVALVQYTPNTILDVSDLDKAQALSTLLASLHPGGLDSDLAIDRCIKVVGQAQAVNVKFSDSARAADLLASLA